MTAEKNENNDEEDIRAQQKLLSYYSGRLRSHLCCHFEASIPRHSLLRALIDHDCCSLYHIESSEEED
jgi:hypothetical protein